MHVCIRFIDSIRVGVVVTRTRPEMARRTVHSNLGQKKTHTSWFLIDTMTECDDLPLSTLAIIRRTHAAK